MFYCEFRVDHRALRTLPSKTTLKNGLKRCNYTSYRIIHFHLHDEEFLIHDATCICDTNMFTILFSRGSGRMCFIKCKGCVLVVFQQTKTNLKVNTNALKDLKVSRTKQPTYRLQKLTSQLLWEYRLLEVIKKMANRISYCRTQKNVFNTKFVHVFNDTSHSI